MTNIQTVLHQINQDLVPQFEEKLRQSLAQQEKDWLIDQIVRLTLDAHSLRQMDRKQVLEAKARARSERIARVRHLELNPHVVKAFLETYATLDREKLIREGFLLPHAPIKGTDLIQEIHRSLEGNRLLQQAKDMLFGLLFGDESTNSHFYRIQRELLTFALPSFKSHALDFMKASTELSAAGTWQDPDSISNDSRAENVLMEVEFGEVEGELIGHGIVRCLSLINNLEVNEQILYARMIDIEQSTLIE